MILSICSRPEILKILMFVRLAINIICIIVPILLIVYLSIDFMKGVTSDDSDIIAKLLKKSIYKFIGAIFIFFIPLIINIIVKTVGFVNSDFASCFEYATPSGIKDAYKEIASARLDSLRKTLSIYDRDNAKIAINEIDDIDLKNELLLELEDLEYYVDLKEKIDNLMNDYSDDKLKGYEEIVKNIGDSNIRKILMDSINNIKKAVEDGLIGGPVITSITNDGVIVKISANKQSADISGYYFSYTNKKPDKNSGGYIASSSESIDVVRLAGTTYVWVEDSAGRVSGVKTINLSNDVLQITLNKYKVLKGTELSEYISSKGGSINELNKLIARSVRAAGLHTKEGAATAAVALQLGLAQKYGVKIPYRMGGKTQSYGAYASWGKYSENKNYPGYDYYGFDCGGFVNWTYFNAGVVYSSLNKDNYFLWPDSQNLPYSKENGEIGDIFRRSAKNGHIEHVSIIVGKNDNSFIVAEAYGKTNGVVINTYPYNKDNDYTIIKGERLFEKYELTPSSSYPSGF